MYWAKIFDNGNAGGRDRTHNSRKLSRAVSHCKTQVQIWREVYQTIGTPLDLKEVVFEMKG